MPLGRKRGEVLVVRTRENELNFGVTRSITDHGNGEDSRRGAEIDVKSERARTTCYGDLFFNIFLALHVRQFRVLDTETPAVQS